MRKPLFLAALLALSLLWGCAAPAPIPDDPGSCTLTFLTIGKGDCFLLTTPAQTHYLIDTGKAEDYPQIARTLREKDIHHLEGIFLTHGHKDHAGCLEPLLTAFPTQTVFLSAWDTVSYTEIDPRTIAPAHQTALTELRGDEVLDLEGVQAQVWLPPVVDEKNANNNSLVLRLTHGKNTFLLMGDAELEEEALLLSSSMDLSARVLKLGHHGETDATSPALLDRVRPDMALIPGNAEENPDSVNETIRTRLDQRGIQPFYSTGEPLDLISDGSTLRTERMARRDLPQTLHLSLTEVDRKRECVTIQNDSPEPARLDGCLLLSGRGHEMFFFPPDTVLEGGAQLRIVTESSDEDGDLLWPENSVWKKKGDPALLYDQNMNLLAADGAEPSVPARSLT